MTVDDIPELDEEIPDNPAPGQIVAILNRDAEARQLCGLCVAPHTAHVWVPIFSASARRDRAIKTLCARPGCSAVMIRRARVKRG